MRLRIDDRCRHSSVDLRAIVALRDGPSSTKHDKENSMRILSLTIAGVLMASSAGAAMAQDWTGGYLSIYGGTALDPDDDNDRIQFDTNLDGGFGDTVNTAAGANAFSPGFCNGGARGAVPSDGCRGNKGGSDFGVRGGYDWQSGSMVYGVLAEYSRPDYRDEVSAFSTTPAFYTMSREIDDVLAIRGRIGFAFGDGGNLLYGTAGYARAGIDNAFATSNGVNTFVGSGDSDADGYQLGLGYERRIGDNFSFGVEYLYSNLDDGDYRVRAQGPAPATNPFILVNAGGTDFSRSDDDIRLESVRVTANWRF
jgi:opacity protein-like surface antigen